MAARPILGLAGLVLTAGAAVLMLLVLLGGAVNGSVLSNFYFLRVDTSGIQGANRDVSQWTLWNICDPGNINCGPIRPAFPFDPVRNFGGPEDLDPSLLDTNRTYLLTRFMFAFVLIALVFAAISLFLGIVALFSRIGSYLSSIMCFVASFFQALVAALMTAAYIIGRDAFNNNNQTATVGRYNFGFEWAAMVCLFLASVLYCIGGSTSKKDTSYGRKNGFLGRKKSTKSRGSFAADNDASSFTRA